MAWQDAVKSFFQQSNNTANLKTASDIRGGTSSIGELDEFLRWKMHIKFAGEGNIQELRQRVPWLYRGIEIIAEATKSFPFEIRDDSGKVIDDSSHWMNELGFTKNLRNLLWKIAASLTVCGASYLYPAYNRLARIKGEPSELKYFVTGTIRPKITFDGGLIGFERFLQGLPVMFDVEGEQTSLLPPECLVHLWLNDEGVEVGPPLAYPAQAALNAAGVLFNLDDFFNQHAKSGLVKAFIASAKGLPPGDAGKDERRRIEGLLSRKLTGKRNIGNVAVAEAESLTITPVGEGFKEMENVPISEEKRIDIAIALGIPASILWARETSHLGGQGVAEEDTFRLIDNKIKPLFEFIAVDGLNEQLFHSLGYEIVPLPERHPVYRKNMTAQAQAVSYFVTALGQSHAGDAMEIVGVDLPEDMDYDQFNAQPATINVTPQPKPLEPGNPETANENLPATKTYQSDKPQTGIMVAFAIPSLIGNKLLDSIQPNLPQGSDVSELDQLHLTLAFLGNTDEVSFSKSELLTALKLFSAHAGFQSGTIGGIGKMNKIESSGKTALYTTFDCPSLPAFHQELISILKTVSINPSQEHGFVPHITLAYIPGDSNSIPATIPSIENVTMTEIVLAWGGEWKSIPLSANIKSFLVGDLHGDLDKWQRKSLGWLRANGNADCPFESDTILATDASALHSALQSAQDETAIKSIFARMETQGANAQRPFRNIKTAPDDYETLRKKYTDDIAALLLAWQSKEISAWEFERRAKAIVEPALTQAQAFGAASQNGYADTTQVEKLIGDEVQNLGAIDQTPIDTQARAELYGRTMDKAYSDAAVQALPASSMLVLDGEDGLESCSTCQKLKGQLHPLSYWIDNGLIPAVGNTNYECQNWRCHHALYDMNHNRVTISSA